MFDVDFFIMIIDLRTIIETGAYLELVNGSQRIDTGHSAIFQSEDDRLMVFPGVTHVLTYQHEIWLERSVTVHQCNQILNQQSVPAITYG